AVHAAERLPQVAHGELGLLEYRLDQAVAPDLGPEHLGGQIAAAREEPACQRRRAGQTALRVVPDVVERDHASRADDAHAAAEERLLPLDVRRRRLGLALLEVEPQLAPGRNHPLLGDRLAAGGRSHLEAATLA